MPDDLLKICEHCASLPLSRYYMSNLVVVFVCLFLGLVFQRLRQFPKESAVALNAYAIYVALPALILNEIPKLTLDSRALLPIVVAWLVMVFAASVTFMCARYLHWSRSVTGAMLLVVTLGNTAFLGTPLVEAYLGEEAISYAILYDQFGSSIVLNTFGIFVASYYTERGQAESEPVWRKIMTFPPFLALILAFVLRFFETPVWMGEALSRLASTLVPVVMVAVGMQWRLRLTRGHRAPFTIALLLILVLEPLFAFGITQIFGFNGLAAHVAILQAGMPAMITAGALASAHDLEPRLASSIVGYSLMLSFFSVWAWQLIL